jgi:Zn-dependent protease with chaperone function
MANLSVCCSGTNHPEFNFPWRARVAKWSCTAFLVGAVWSGSSQAQQSPEAATQEPDTLPVEAAPAQSNSTGEIKNRQPKYDVDRIGTRGVGKGINFYSLEKEQRLGDSMAKRVDRHTKFVADQSVSDYINRLGQKLARNSDAQLPFTIKVIDSDDVKVFALPGGYLYVDSGLILAVDSEAELAGMMAHEIAHVAARHATRSATRMYAWDAIAIPLTYFGGPAGIGLQQIAGLGAPLSFKKFSRNAENEADLLGIEYQYASGYDPEAYVEALEKLQKREAFMHGRMAKLPGFRVMDKLPLHQLLAKLFAGYPKTQERIRRVQNEIATLLPAKEEYITSTSEFDEVKAKLAWAQRPVLRRHAPGEGNQARPVLRRTRTQENTQ